MNSEDEKYKLYINKVLLAYIEEPIHKFHKEYYIPVVYKIDFNWYHVHIPKKS